MFLEYKKVTNVYKLKDKDMFLYDTFLFFVITLCK
jgi:hypothetical protein